jgi:hypothetical protein
MLLGVETIRRDARRHRGQSRNTITPGGSTEQKEM